MSSVHENDPTRVRPPSPDAAGSRLRDARAVRLALLRQKVRVVGIAEMAVSTDSEEVLVTHSLGSCIGLTLYDPLARVGGLVHCMMPLSRADPIKARESPAAFVDSGVSALLQAVFSRGATRRHLVAKVAGAARSLDPNEVFRVGERNYAVLRKILWKNDILIAGEDVGGTAPRTLYLFMATGETMVVSGGACRTL